jgi:hypothetical protein
MSKQVTEHLSDGELLRYTDGEVGSRDAKRIRKHLEACWECRTQRDELEQTVGDCVRYRNAVRDQMPDPPAPWFDIQRQCEKIDGAARREAWSARVWDGMTSLIARPRRWSMALATIVIAVLVVDQFRNAPSVRAAELLEDASVAAETSLMEPRHIEITSGSSTITRTVGGAQTAALASGDESVAAALQPLFQEANYSWDDPLSAAAFAAWRESLSEKDDEVITISSPLAPEQKVYRIRTTTPVSSLTEATLQFAVEDLKPLQGTYRFRGHALIEIAALAALPAPPVVVAEAAPAPVAPVANPAPARVEVITPATPGEELQVLAALHRLGADLGAPVEVSRAGSQVVVSGSGVDPELGHQIRGELAGMHRVTVDFTTPRPTAVEAVPLAVESVTVDPRVEQLQAEMEAELGGRANYDQFTGEILNLSDTLMSRVHALRRLAEHFAPENEALMSLEERELLSDLLREHATAAAELSARIEQQSRPVLLAVGATGLLSDPELPVADNWQDATAELLADARQVDILLAGILGGASTETSPQDLSSHALLSLTQLRIRTSNYLQNALQ